MRKVAITMPAALSAAWVVVDGSGVGDCGVRVRDSSFRVYNLDGNIPEEGLLAVIDQATKESRLNREVAMSRELAIKGR
jgi:hypothetical protein